MNKYRLILFLVLGVTSCNPNADKKNVQKTKDHALVFALEFILKNNKLPKEFYEQPLQIKKNHLVPYLHEPIIVNDRKCIILPEDMDIQTKLRGMDIFKPYPIVEINEYKIDHNMLRIMLIFRTIGNVYNLTLENSKRVNYYTVLSYDQYQI
jgi:hypothetical protein